MPGKVKKSLRDKTLHNVLVSELSKTDKDCIVEVFINYEHMLDHEKHGRWKIGNGSFFPVYQCSLCGGSTPYGTTKYCPYCGTKMDLEEGETK